ncbi:zf-HC2 domain-containing protein [Acidiferrobacter thiooxydans]|uniref:zf-HC2 domain-containing protein n=1 Tax=Acidiferrobacter thiooxydans TaxID=163359 RepID=UPI000824C7F3|nr:zf-HC2 domain-containing protein [Acidiferrobacter thiooxydans]UEO00443.1 zf-HC2 domain-containing protein [Acidiferrobacter thiooxydans]
MNFMMRCREVTQHISKAHDGELRGWKRLAILMHLAFCRACRAFARDTKHLQARMREPGGPGDSDLSPQARQRLLDAAGRDEESDD